MSLTGFQSFFGMDGMFNWHAGPGDRIASPYIWVFFVITIPLTALVYAVWFWWFKVSQKHYQKRHEEGLEGIEMKLRSAVRSATTGTW